MSALDTTNSLTTLVFQTRTDKPRDQGITMMADWGLDPHRQENLLSVAGPFIDQAKIAVGIAALLSQEILTQKLKSYRQHDIVPFPGGQFLEHAVLNNKRNEYLKAVTAAGFDTIEVSDNLLEISLDEKCEIIRTAREQHGLRIFGEVGKKEGLTSTTDLAEDAARCLEFGAEIVFLEAADFFSGDVNEEMLEKIISRCGLKPLVFELPGPWIKGVTLSDVHQMTCWLLDRFGTDTNIANVGVDEVLKLEALRLKIGVNAGGE